MLESAIKNKIIKYLLSIGAHPTPVPAGKYGYDGEPDMIACYMGRYIAIEGKTSTGQQEYDQEVVQKEIEDAGGRYVIARSVEDVQKVIHSINEDIKEGKLI